MTPVESAYAQMFSVGILWISIHCSGMCGPLLIGLDVTGAARGCSARVGAGNVLVYELGRAFTYALLGAAFGLLGAGIQHGLLKVGGWLSVSFGLAMLLYLASTVWRKVRGRDGSQVATTQPFMTSLVLRLARPLVGKRSTLHTLALGMVMGLLPCMISMWALSLAALTGSPFHGSVIMVLLVAMSTPMLLGVTLLPRILGSRLQRWRGQLPQGLMGVSGTWLVMAGGAALGWFPHFHFGFNVMGRDFAVMFW